MNPKLLIVTYYWAPSGGAGVQRILKFTKYLPEFGIDPVVLTVKNPTYPITDQSLLDEVPASLPVHKTKTYEPYGIYAKLAGKKVDDIAKPTSAISTNKTIIGQLAAWLRANIFLPDARIGWQISARKKACEIIESEHISAVLTTGTPHSVHFTGLKVSRKYNIPWIADFRDPWGQIHYNQHLPRSKPARSLDRKMEQTVLKEADEVLVVSPSMIDLQKKVWDRNYRVITNGFDPEDFGDLSQPPPENEQVTMRYVGSLSETMIPHSFFETLAQLKQNKMNFQVEFVGNVHPEIQVLIEKHKLEKFVEISPYLPHEDAITKMRTADILLVIIPDVDFNELILTGKLFDYMATRRPILLLGPPNSDAANIIAKMQCGVVRSLDDKNGIQQFLEQAITNHPEPVLELPEIDLQNHPYSRITLTKKLGQIVKNQLAQ